MADAPSQVALQKLVDDAIASERNDRDHPHWHVSSLGNCLSGQVLERRGATPDVPFTPRLLRVFNVGHIFEEWVLNLAEKALPEGQTMKRQEDLLDAGNDVSGHPDAVIYQGDEATLIREIKTIHSRGFWHMAREGRAGYSHHRLQLWMYLKMKNVREGRLTYLSKDDLAINEYPVYLYDEGLQTEAAEILHELNTAWRQGTIPEPILDPKDWRYQYCSYHLQCLEAAGHKTVFVKTRSRTNPFREVTLEDRRKELQIESESNEDE